MALPPFVTPSIGLLAIIQVILIICVITLFNRQPEVKKDTMIFSTSPSSVSDGYVYGGVMNEGQGEWVIKQPIIEARSDLQAIVCAGKVYLLGGYDESNNVSGSVIEYDPVFETQTLKAEMTPRARFGAGCVDGKIYVAGGMTASGDAPQTATGQVYNPTTDTWAAISDMPSARSDHTALGVNGNVYFMFGYDSSYEGMNSVVAYDPVAETWATKTPSPHTGRGDVSCTLHPDSKTIVVAGGWGGDDYSFQTDVELYDVLTDKWSAVADIPKARGDMSVVTHNGRIHVIGGEIWSGKVLPCAWDASQDCNVNAIPTHEHYVLDMANNVWGSGAPIPTARFRFSSVDVNGAIFVFGGHGDGERVVDTVETFYDLNTEPIYYYIREDVVVAASRRLRA